MRASVRAAFVSFTEPLEGSVPFMYLDQKGLVTTAIGNLIDPLVLASGLPFMRPDGTPATWDEVAQEWRSVKARTDLAHRGGMAFKSVTRLRLTPEGVDRVVQAKLMQVDAYLARRFADAYIDAPADGQLGLLSMSWAAGPAFHYPKLEAHLRAGEWEGVAEECTLNPNVGTIVRRNEANKTLFRNAGRIVENGLCPEMLYWPQVL